MQVPANRITALGEVSPWGRQFLQTLQAGNVLDVGYEPDVSHFCSHPNAVGDSQIIFVENQPESRTWILSLRQSGKQCFIVWYGRSFSKDDYRFSLENRIYIVFENLRSDDQKLLDWLAKLTESRENAVHFAGIVRAVKAVLVQADQEHLSKQIIPELKTAVSKLEKSGSRNEFLLFSDQKPADTQTKLPFHRTQDFSDALTTIAELERTGILWIKGSLPNQEGRVEFLQGKIVSAHVGDVDGLKAIWRVFLWDSPRFLFARSETKEFTFDEHLNVSLKFICTQGDEQKFRFEQIRKEIPPLELKLELEPSMLHKGTVCPSEDFPALASVVENGVVSHILDYNELPDVDLYESLIRLRRSNILRVSVAK